MAFMDLVKPSFRAGTLSLLIGIASQGRCAEQSLVSMPPLTESSPIQIVEGPTLLHANVAGEWGGHTFSYILIGDKNVFWAGMLYEPGRTSRTMLIGQYPRKGINQLPVVSSVSLDTPDFYNSSLPLLVRTPDGFIHILVGVTHDTGKPNLKPGTLRYFRSAAPDDITSVVDRTEMIPKVPYGEFHLRMNVGLSVDGKKLVWVVLAVSSDGKVPFNTPVVFFAEHKGTDFSFQNPVAYAPAMGLFYPLVAVVESGAIVVGELWDDAKTPHARLVQFDWDGKVTHQEDLPKEVEGSHCVYDLKPMPGQPENFILYATKTPADKQHCAHEFWEYSSREKQLRLLRSIETEYSWTFARRLPTPATSLSASASWGTSRRRPAAESSPASSARFPESSKKCPPS